MRKLSYFLVLVGFLILLVPSLMEWKADQEQNELLKEAEQARHNRMSKLDPSLSASYERVSQLLAEETAEAQPVSAQLTTAGGNSPIATIEIPAIDLKLPVLEGATKENMKHAATHMSETPPLGKSGNAAIAAHRAHKKGRLFNRLNEVVSGDKIIINTETERFTYVVYKISVVEPTDLSVLEDKGKEKILTLITCDPLKNPTHRLIVQAKLE
ncbi:class D sortase [Paenibacillus puldeungensis]|uniref:Class D sortase n=1 Tax=Paenibacillus puldeungensis TaxID=696536 RepID=A0ABW3RZV1_9BACL